MHFIYLSCIFALFCFIISFFLGIFSGVMFFSLLLRSLFLSVIALLIAYSLLRILAIFIPELAKAQNITLDDDNDFEQNEKQQYGNTLAPDSAKEYLKDFSQEFVNNEKESTHVKDAANINKTEQDIDEGYSATTDNFNEQNKDKDAETGYLHAPQNVRSKSGTESIEKQKKTYKDGKELDRETDYVGHVSLQEIKKPLSTQNDELDYNNSSDINTSLVLDSIKRQDKNKIASSISAFLNKK